MFNRIRNFFYNHRRKFFFGGVFVGSLIIVARYARGKLIKRQEMELKELLEKSRRQQHFEETESTCKQTVLILSRSLRNAIIKCINCEEVVNKLRQGPKDKISTWNTLKVLAISRTAAIIYSYTMIVIILKIQFNVLSGSMYKNNISKSSKNADKIDETTQEKYLLLSRYLIENGLQKLSLLIQEKVESVISFYSLSFKLHLRDVQQIYWAIVSSVSADESKDPVKNFASYMVASDIMKHNTDQVFNKLLDDTLDLLESQEVQNLMQVNLRSGFNLLIDRISEYFIQNAAGDGELAKQDNIVYLNSVTMSLVKIIPILNGQVPENPMKDDLPSDWLQKLLLSKELDALGYNIYEAIAC